jgi:hypothetical protein
MGPVFNTHQAHLERDPLKLKSELTLPDVGLTDSKFL